MQLIRSVAMAAAILLVSISALAQGTTGTISGTVTHEGSPLPGATVTISSPNLQGVRTTVTGETGGYVFPGIPPGEYVVRVEMMGMQTTTRTVRVGVATSARADANLRLTSVAEAITVTASAPAVVETTEVATNITARTVDELPMARTVGATALLAPGVQTAFGRANQLNISGAPGYDNLILVNGVVVQENLRAQIHNLFIEDAIQETTVLQGGISAEYGRFTGGVVSTLTKSGGNEFSGSLRDSLTNPSWKEKTPWANQADPVDELSEVYEATLGGYVLRDRLWFFAAGRSVESAEQRFTSISNIAYTLGQEETRMEGKLTGRIGANHNLVASYLDVKNDITNNWFGTIYDTRSLYNQGQPNSLATLHYNGILTSNLLLEASYSQKDFTFVGGGAPTRDRIEGTLLVDTSNGSRRYWSPTFCGVCSDEERNNDSWIAKGTYYLNTASLGGHTIVGGVENFAETRLVNNHQSGSDFRILSGTVRDGNAVMFGPHGGPFPVFTSGTIVQWNPILFVSPGSDLQTRSIFVNDRWDLNQNFSFNIGLRYDKNDATDSFGNVVSDDSAFSPRVGVTYDVFGNGRTRVNATYGRYVSKIMDGNVGGAASPAGNPASITFFYRGPDINVGDGPYLGPAEALTAMWAAFDAAYPNLSTSNYLDHPWFRSASIPGASTVFVEPIVSPAMDEITLGVGTALFGSAFVRADYIMRDWNNFYQNLLTLETGKTADGRGDRSIMRNTDELVREYRGVHLQAGWRPSRYNLGASYTYATLRGNDGSEASATATSPNATLAGWYPEYLGYSQRLPIGSLDGDVRHRLKTWAGVDIPLGFIGRINVSALHTFASGEAYGASGTIDASGRTTPFAGSPTNPGYTLSRLGDQHTYWFTDRDGFRTPNFNRTDLALNYTLPVWRVQVFAQAEMFNVFDNAEVTTPNSTVRTRRSAGANSGLVSFNPFTDTPIECPQGAAASQCSSMGAHWQKGPQFGQPTGPTSYQDPREYRFSLGLRF